MKKQIYSDVFSADKYKLIILDMDGTLYYQRAMQIRMCMEMGAFAVMHPFLLWKLNVISEFRRIREKVEYGHISKEDGDLLEMQYGITAQNLGKTPQQVKEVIKEWMFVRPLKYIYAVADHDLAEWIVRWKKQGKIVVVFSDYPVKDKCEALQIRPDFMCSSDEGPIGEMKPSPKGLEMIALKYGVPKEWILVVGDRMSKDGEMAKAAGADYVILNKWKFLRKKYY